MFRQSDMAIWKIALSKFGKSSFRLHIRFREAVGISMDLLYGSWGFRFHSPVFKGYNTTQKNKHVNRVNQLQGQLKLLNPILQFLPCSRSILPNEPSALKSYPLVNIQKTMENHHVSWENSLQMAIFNSYVKLPEGNII